MPHRQQVLIIDVDVDLAEKDIRVVRAVDDPFFIRRVEPIRENVHEPRVNTVGLAALSIVPFICDEEECFVLSDRITSYNVCYTKLLRRAGSVS